MVAAHVHEILDIAARAGKWRGCDGSDIKAQLHRASGNRFNRFHVVLRIAHHSPVAESFLSDLKLRLHHQQEVSIGRCCGDESRKNKRQRNERHISHDQLGGGSDGRGIESTHVRAIMNLDAGIGLQLPGKLSVSHVHGNDGSRTASQQHVCKATS